MRMRSMILGVVAALFSHLPASAGTVYDVAKDFSTSANPDGVWSYGYSTTLGGAFHLYTDEGVRDGLDTWRSNIAGDGNPAVYHNGSTNDMGGGTPLFAPGQFALHPGPDGEFSIVRFTAPTGGTYVLAAEFSGMDPFGTTTDVHTFLNGVSLFDGVINGYGSLADFTRTLSLSASDHLDFIVGYGANQTFYDDTTGLSATLTFASVPEPGSVVLAGIGIATVLAWRCRNR